MIPLHCDFSELVHVALVSFVLFYVRPTELIQLYPALIKIMIYIEVFIIAKVKIL